ncbi:MAG TPA: DinB family protein [Bryobacteraceae bacterium]|jgi:hypothetical protein|nr:DinB family protein [Bryobacteraceae bacterium]
MEILNIEPCLHYYERLRERTVEVAGCIPPDAIEWTYAPGKFSFGDILRHLAAIERYMYAETYSSSLASIGDKERISPTATKPFCASSMRRTAK